MNAKEGHIAVWGSKIKWECYIDASPHPVHESQENYILSYNLDWGVWFGVLLF